MDPYTEDPVSQPFVPNQPEDFNLGEPSFSYSDRIRKEKLQNGLSQLDEDFLNGTLQRNSESMGLYRELAGEHQELAAREKMVQQQAVQEQQSQAIHQTAQAQAVKRANMAHD